MWFWGLLFFLAALAILYRMFTGPGRRRPAPLGKGDLLVKPTRADDGPGHQAVLGPDQTNVNPPESYVIHHEGKGQGMDVAGAALQERTQRVTADAPGDAGVPANIPGRTPVYEEEIVAGATGDTGDGARGPLRPSAAGTHMEAAAELAYPFRTAPYVGTHKEQAGAGQTPREQLRHRVIDLAARMRTGPTPSHPGQGNQDPGHQAKSDGAAEDRDHWAPLQDSAAPPAGYDVDEVVLLPTAPGRGYAYWELGGGAEGRLPAPVLASSRRALRIYDLTCDALCAQYEVGELHDHWWLDLPHHGHEYAAELGRVDSAGQWLPLARSAPLQTPWAGVTPLGAGGWSPGARA